MENQASGGAASFGRSTIQGARPKVLRSHRGVAQAAAENCTADWPDADSWEAEALQEGRWVDGDPMAYRRDGAEEGNRPSIRSVSGARMDAVSQLMELRGIREEPEPDDLEELQRQNEQAAAIEREAWYELETSKRLRRARAMRQKSDALLSEINDQDRTDGVRMDARVADAAVAVVQQLAAVSRAWPRMGPRARLLAQEATRLATQALKQAGVDQLAAYGEAV